MADLAGGFQGGATFEDVRAAYRLLLHRGVNQEEMRAYSVAVKEGVTLDTLLEGILASPEYRELQQANRDVVTAYQVLLGRSPDPDGLSHHVGLVRTGLTLENLAQELMRSQESRDGRERLDDVQMIEVDGRYKHVRPSDTYIGRGSSMVRAKP